MSRKRGNVTGSGDQGANIEYLPFVLIGLIGSLASAVFGFGTALLVLAGGAHVRPIKEAIALSTVLFTAWF